ncbi:MAG TPA: hypothetical protein VFW44_17365 [Bryobacteraceae bacterium]|nr:hypothetical protein [Bryobacteraceae bacterium]
MLLRALALAIVPAALLAQWPAFKTASAPRLANGKINMDAPAPKAADGHPDLSGVWNRGMVPGAPPPASNFAVALNQKPSGPRAFQDLPSLFPDGLPLQPWAAKLRAERLASNSKDHPDAHCLPLSPVQLHSHPQARKVIQTPAEVLILYEANNGIRQIFTDGRPLPADDPDPWWYGYSIGHWDGDTLVIESTGFKDMGWLDEEGTPNSSALRLTERFRRLNYGTLEIETTVDDPKTFTHPWSFKLQQHLMPDTDLIEFICLENNTSIKHLVGK